MNNEITIKAKFCHFHSEQVSDECNDMVLKVPQSEAAKLQIVEHSNAPDLGQFNKSYLMSGLGLVLFCYLFAFAIGQVVKQFK
ncbi:hypothetical protein ACWX9T_03155 [Pasteurella multocida]|uniref:hypothetical protein n=1 Tax=Pasteurella multocida TaxID=747 RepID=UPI000C198176|nr:hypothetical protein [Pasteurella multocida]MCW4598676.1 hypothetical protein [Pasteurella multocida subsp. multocida]MEB3472284.1 hypothetical protein [Pasteurella multocida]NNI15154.1 hypothetical protein [Pasteurella multocida]NNI15163.1 hypothetical protein [Pasteurella multocida]NNI58748.1 hypothetical protein [Pasteurella multocida]